MATGTTKMDIKLANAVTAIGTYPASPNQLSGSMFGYSIDDWSCQVTVTGTGALTANGTIDVSNDGIGWINDSNSTFALSGSNLVSFGFVSDKPWKYARLNLTTLTGTGAAVTATLAG